MLRKINQKDLEGNELYQEVLQLGKEHNFEKLYGKVGTLKKLSNLPLKERLNKGTIKINQ